MRRWLSRLTNERCGRWARAAAMGGAGLLLVAGFLILACELTAARVPQHRAALERLVRAQTGLDVHFEELGVRWGWYGPEAVFSHVELGAAGRAAVFLRAPELVVVFDAWHTLLSGSLRAGRITLVAPDIDLTRAMGAPRSTLATTARGASLFKGWRDGRIDIDGGTLHVATSNPRAQPLLFAIRRATLYRSQDQWSAQAFVLLPERLGSSARVELRVRGNPDELASLGGTLRFDGVRLVFAGWRELAGDASFAHQMPVAGGGDFTLNAAFSAGRVTEARGFVHAGGVAFADSASASRRLFVDRVRGNWHLQQRSGLWHAEIDDLAVGRTAEAADAAVAHVEVDMAGTALQASATTLPLQSLAALAAWAAPQFGDAGIEVSGAAHEINIDWDAARAAGARLKLAAKLSDFGIAQPLQGWSLSGLNAQLSGDENAWSVDLEGRSAELATAGFAAEHLTALNIASHLLVSRSRDGVSIATDALYIKHDQGRLRLAGSVSLPAAANAARYALQGVLADVDVALLQRLAPSALTARFGAAASRLEAGRIEEARFAQTSDGGFSGSLTLKDARIADVPGLDAHGVDARIDWNRSRITAAVEQGRAGPLQLGPMRLEWRGDAKSPMRIDGHATGRIEDTLTWVRAHAALLQFVPDVKTLAARGNAQFDFDLSILPDAGALSVRAARQTQAHVAVSLEGASVLTGPGMPAIEAVRGTLAFDGGHLQRSSLTARWLGGPVSLRVAEHAERRANVFVVKAQGLLDVRELAALGTFADPASLAGEAEWSGDFILSPDSKLQRARWQAHLDAPLTGITSRLPEPLTKAAGIVAPLHIEITGSAARAEVRVALAERLHSVFEIRSAGEDAWRVERGSVRFGGSGPVALASEPAVVLSGSIARLEASPYVATWNRVRHDVVLPPVSGAVFVSELLAAGDVYADANLTVRRSAPGDLQIEPLGGQRRPGS